MNWKWRAILTIIVVMQLEGFGGYLMGRAVAQRNEKVWLKFHLADFLEEEMEFEDSNGFNSAGTDGAGRGFELHFHLLPKGCNPMLWYDGTVTCSEYSQEVKP